MLKNQLSDPDTWVDQHGDYLFGYALLRLRDRPLSEDVVQETFLAALNARKSFSGNSSERTWLVGILKNKIVDHIRKVSREHLVDDVEPYADVEEFFDQDGGWKTKPNEWMADPATVFEGKEFWEIFSGCLSVLPSRLHDAFSLRELEGLDSPEVCKVLNISATNLWVILHRARIQLRDCLEAEWFNYEKGSDI